jgi:hypothetical protein
VSFAQSGSIWESAASAVKAEEIPDNKEAPEILGSRMVVDGSSLADTGDGTEVTGAQA